jgi:hypothetical protein
MVDEIPDFKLDKETVTKCMQTRWIVRAPKALFFQLQRVIYDKEKSNSDNNF